MSTESNSETCKVLNTEIKALQSQCKELCYIIENNESMHIRTINPQNANEKKLCSIESLTKNIQNVETPIVTDFNVNTSLFLSELKERITQVEELTAITRGALNDVVNENNSKRANIKIVQEAKSRPPVGRREVQPEHLQRARRRFQSMKTELQGLIHSLFPGTSEAITGVLGELMSEKINETSSGYIPITPEKYHLIELLKDKNIVSTNPYNEMEVRLTF